LGEEVSGMADRTALLVIDLLNDFVLEGAPLQVPDARKIVAPIRAQIEKARKQDIPIFYLCDRHRADDPEFKVWPRHAVQGTPGAEVIAELAPAEGDWVVPKTSYSAFFNTDLDERLRESGVEHLIFTGFVTNICVLYTAVDAYMRGYTVEVPEDCVGGLNEEDHRFALRQIKEILKPRR